MYMCEYQDPNMCLRFEIFFVNRVFLLIGSFGYNIVLISNVVPSFPEPKLFILF